MLIRLENRTNIDRLIYIKDLSRRKSCGYLWNDIDFTRSQIVKKKRFDYVFRYLYN